MTLLQLVVRQPSPARESEGVTFTESVSIPDAWLNRLVSVIRRWAAARPKDYSWARSGVNRLEMPLAGVMSGPGLEGHSSFTMLERLMTVSPYGSQAVAGQDGAGGVQYGE